MLGNLRNNPHMLNSLISASGFGDVTLLAEIGVIFFLLGLIAFAAARFQISAVPFFLLVGLAFGEGGISDVDVSGEYLDTTAAIGALLLLLLLGLEYSARELATSIQVHYRAGILDFAFNAIPGALLGWMLGWGIVGVVGLAGITYVSSSGIASQLMRDAGAQRSEVAKRTVSILVIEDLALAPYLPIVTALVSGISVWQGLISVGVALIITGLVLIVGMRTENWFAQILNSPDPRALLLTVLGAALMAAGGAELIGFSGAVAAFLVGLILSGEVANAVRLRLGPLRDLASSVFFLFFGLATDPRDIPEVLPYAIGLAIVGTVGKFAVAKYITRGMLDPMSWRRVGAFLTPRGEFSILIAGLLGAATFSTELQAMTTAYVITTAIIGSIFVMYWRSGFAIRTNP
jgi:monovalent cation:H+ antiporter-2, CPA2 family